MERRSRGEVGGFVLVASLIVNMSSL